VQFCLGTTKRRDRVRGIISSGEHKIVMCVKGKRCEAMN